MSISFGIFIPLIFKKYRLKSVFYQLYNMKMKGENEMRTLIFILFLLSGVSAIICSALDEDTISQLSLYFMFLFLGIYYMIRRVNGDNRVKKNL